MMSRRGSLEDGARRVRNLHTMRMEESGISVLGDGDEDAVVSTRLECASLSSHLLTLPPYRCCHQRSLPLIFSSASSLLVGPHPAPLLRCVHADHLQLVCSRSGPY